MIWVDLERKMNELENLLDDEYLKVYDEVNIALDLNWEKHGGSQSKIRKLTLHKK